MTTEPDSRPSLTRRTVLKRAAATAAVPATAALLGLGAAEHRDRVHVGRAALLRARSHRFARARTQRPRLLRRRISGHLYWITDSFYQAMFLATRDGVVLVDAPPTIGHNLLRAIQDVTDATGTTSRVTHLIYSHNHADHIGAAALFGSGVERIGQTQTRELLRAAADPTGRADHDLRRHTHGRGRRRTARTRLPRSQPLAGQHLRARTRPRDPMLVDVVFPGWVPFKHLAESQDIPGWIAAHDTALDYRWTTLVGGHLGRLGTRADAHLQQNYVTDLEASARTTLNTLDPTPYFAKYGPTANAWAIFKTYLDAAAQQAATPVTNAYLGRLAAADVFTLDNAHTMVNSLRIDNDVLGPFSIHP